MLHQEQERGRDLGGSSWCRKAFPFTSPTASNPRAEPRPLRKPSRSRGASIFSNIHPTLHCSSSKLLFLHFSRVSPQPVLCSGSRPTSCTLRAFQLLPHVPAGCQLLYTKSLFLNPSFVNGPKNFRPLAAIFIQLLGTHLPPTTQMMYGCWTPSHMH